MTSIVHPVVPKGVKIVYTSTSNFSQEDYSLFDSILKTQGISWSTLRSKAEKYITIGKLPSDIKPGGPSLTNSSYFYAHTIDNFFGARIPETVIYVGISGDEDISKIGFKEQFGRAFDKNEGNRNWLWYIIISKVEGHKIHILPLRLKSSDCTKMETYFIDTLGRFCYPAPYRGPLVNLQRDRRDPKEQSEKLLRFYEDNPHLKGEEGVLSIVQKKIWSDSSIREAQSDRLNNHIATLTEEQKQAWKDRTTKHFEPFKGWKADFVEQFRYDITLFDNYKNIEVTDDYTKKLEEIQESGFFYRQKRRDHAKRNSKAYGLDLVFPEYQEKKIKTYLEENDLSLDEVSSVLGQCDAYWIADNQALLNHFLAIEKSIESNDQASGKEKCSFGTPCGALSSITTEDSQIDNTKKLSNAVARMEVAMSKVEELENWESWVEKTLEPYKHEVNYGTRSKPANYLTDPKYPDYIRSFEEIKKRPDIFIRYGRADTAKRSGWDWDLIYLEMDKKRGPCWAPSKKLLQNFYQEEVNRINTLKLKALQSEGLVKKN